MIVDSSALIAILIGEPDRAGLIAAIADAEAPTMAAPTWLESRMVFAGKEPPDAAAFDAVVAGLGIRVVPFDGEMADIAFQAFRRFGRGSKHPARLNFGDCMAYALAKKTGSPLLFKGDDFIHTDITPALA